MNISKLICGIAALTLLADVALAAPDASAQVAPNAPAPAQVGQAAQLTHTSTATRAAVKQKPQLLADAQLDTVTAGETLKPGDTLGIGEVYIVFKSYGDAFHYVCTQAGANC